MVRMPETRFGMVAAAFGVLIVVGVVLPLAFIGGLTLAFSSGPAFGDGGTPMIHGPVTAETVYDGVSDAAGGDDRTGSGAQYGCRLVAVGGPDHHGRMARPVRIFRCVVPGHGAGDVAYRVTARTSSACWHARGDAPPLDGCIRVAEPEYGGFD